MSRRWICSMRSKIRSATVGARPIDGSSSISSFGEQARPRPIATICCSPPDRVPASCARRSASTGKQGQDAVEVAAPAARPAGSVGAHLQILDDGHAREHLAAFRHVRDAEVRALRRQARRSKSRPSNEMRPLPGTTVPEMALNSVVLPAPLGPTMATNCPSLTCNDTSVSACDPPYETVSDSTCSNGVHPFAAEIGFDDRRGPRHLAPARPRPARCRGRAPAAASARRTMACIVWSMMTTVVPSLRERADHSDHLLDFLPPEPGQGLVQQQQLRARRQRARQLHQPQLAGW